MLPKVVVTNRVHDEVLEFLGRRSTLDANPDREPWGREELLMRAHDAKGLITFMNDRVDDDFLGRCPDLGIIACALKGADNFDVDACTRRGVWLTIVPDLLTAPAAELAVGLMVALARRIGEGDRLVKGGSFGGWRPVLFGASLDKATVGLIGAGRLGTAIARRLRGFGCTVLYHDEAPLAPEQERSLVFIRAPFEEILKRSDFVVLAAPLTGATHHLIDARTLGRLKPGAYLVNICRGSVVDEDAVADALADGHLAGYAADVFEMEDWALPGRPRTIAPRLLAEGARTLLTPHLGSAVTRVRADIEMAATASVIQYLDGERPDGALNEPAAEGHHPG
ncbi:MAG: hydroxyacid dehydrogenase [Proteobacteria bacterium]|nr:hydroxyacid dehydrogenase [Pseudomonadota bacterium]